MLNNLKLGLFAVVGLFVAYTFLTGNQGGAGSATAQLDRALGIASDTATDFENTPDVTEANALDKFATKYNEGLNAAEPPLNPNPLGLNTQEDGSLLSFDDTNANGVQDEGEQSLFMMEVDAENNRLVATNREESRESGFSGSGLLMGYMLGSMMSRQRATGSRPAARKATARGTPSRARSRSGSGSHSRGK